MRDNVSKLGTIYPGLDLPTRKTSVNGPWIDLAPFNAATIYIHAGNWTDGTHNFIIEESPDNGTTINTVAATDLVAWAATSPSDPTPVKVGNAQPSAISSAATAVNQRIGYIGGQRYIRVRTNVAGSPVTGAQYNAVVVAGEPRNLPSAV